MQSSPKATTHPSRLDSDRSVEAGQEWQRYGRCLNEEPDIFFLTDEESTKAAKAICRTCIVKVRCLSQALVACEEAGIWGGLTAEELTCVRASLLSITNQGRRIVFPSVEPLTDELRGDQAAGQANAGVNISSDIV